MYHPLWRKPQTQAGITQIIMKPCASQILNFTKHTYNNSQCKFISVAASFISIDKEISFLAVKTGREELR
jgi:hypothetical protein